MPPKVQRFAAEGVLAQTESQAFLDYCRRQPRKVAKFLLRLAEKAEADAATSRAAALVAAGGGAVGEKAARQAAMEAAAASAAGSAALQALVNISTVPAVCEELLELSAVRRVCEAMRGGWLEGRSGLVHWYAMLLSNLTTSPKGQEPPPTRDARAREARVSACPSLRTLRALARARLSLSLSAPRPSRGMCVSSDGGRRAASTCMLLPCKFWPQGGLAQGPRWVLRCGMTSPLSAWLPRITPRIEGPVRPTGRVTPPLS